jgi:outer membrane biosynthesis protein TonB
MNTLANRYQTVLATLPHETDARRAGVGRLFVPDWTPREVWRIWVVVVVSILAHLLLILFVKTVKPMIGDGDGTPPAQPLKVTLNNTKPADSAPAAPAANEVAIPETVQLPKTVKAPTPPRPQTQAKPLPTPAPPEIVATSEPMPARVPVQPTQSAPPEAPQPQATTPSAEPPTDFAALVAARRAQRQATQGTTASERAEAAKQGDGGQSRADANMASNLQQVTRSNSGPSGVFQILHKGQRTAQFSFRGWANDSRGTWKEVIEVDAGVGGNVELAIVRRMIALIRTHYKGNFNFESYKLNRVVVLSARPEDNTGLEEFLMREFFG